MFVVLKKLIKRIPGAQWVIQHLWSSSSPGSWLYSHEIVAWLYEPAVKRQLPALYRFFATYCAFQKRAWQHPIIGGERVLQSVILVTKMLRLREHVQLDLAPERVFLDLCDPRMLSVPTDVRNASVTAVLRSLISEGDTFIDAGANHGTFSIRAARLVGPTGLVVAVEPQTRLAKLVEKSLAANAKCRYQVHNIACGDREGYADFYVPAATSGRAGLLPGFSATSAHRRFSVPLKRLDDLVDWQCSPGRIFLKVDVEGSELALIRGASAMIRTRKPHIMIEINPGAMRAAGVTGDALVGELRGLGYDEFMEARLPADPQSLRSLDLSRQHDVILRSDGSRCR